MSNDLHMPCNESAMFDDDSSDWLHKNDAYMRKVSTSSGLHGQDSFVTNSSYSEKKRQRDCSEETRQRHRERYSLMPDGQRHARLQKNRDYKISTRETRSVSSKDDILAVTISLPCTPIIHAEPSATRRTGIVGMLIMIFPDILLHLPGEPHTNSNEDADPSGIFEPTEQDVVFACKIADF
jgi:hypothetical protein